METLADQPQHGVIDGAAVAILESLDVGEGDLEPAPAALQAQLAVEEQVRSRFELGPGQGGEAAYWETPQRHPPPDDPAVAAALSLGRVPEHRLDQLPLSRRAPRLPGLRRRLDRIALWCQVEQHRDDVRRGGAVEHGVVSPVDDRDLAVWQAAENGHVPERAAHVQRPGQDPGDRGPEGGAVGGGP